MVKRTQTIRRQFVGLALKGLKDKRFICKQYLLFHQNSEFQRLNFQVNCLENFNISKDTKVIPKDDPSSCNALNYTGTSHCVKSVQIQSYFLSVFSCIRTEYGDLLCKSPYSV